MKNALSKPAAQKIRSNEPENGTDITGAGTVTRIVKLLACIAEADAEVSIKSLCQTLDLPASTVHRLLSLLIKEGMVERAPSRALYGPGLEYLRIGSLVAAKIRVVDLAKPVIRALVQDCDETCVLLHHIPTSQKVMALHVEYSTHPLRYQIDLFQPHSLVWGATGRSVLAFLSEAEIETAVRNGEPSPATGEALPPLDVLMKELNEIRVRGYVMTQGQNIPGAVGLAAPLFNAEHRPIGCLSVTIPKTRYSQKAASRIANLLLESSATLNRSLGYKDPRRDG